MSLKLQAIVTGAVVVALVSSSYLAIINLFCCLGVIIGGMVSVWYYTDRANVTIEPGTGATLGLGAAVLGGILAALLDIPLNALGVGSEGLAEFLMGLFVEADQMEMQAEVGLGQRIFFGIAVIAITGVFGAVGGAIGASLFKKGGEGMSAED